MKRTFSELIVGDSIGGREITFIKHHRTRAVVVFDDGSTDSLDGLVETDDIQDPWSVSDPSACPATNGRYRSSRVFSGASDNVKETV